MVQKTALFRIGLGSRDGRRNALSDATATATLDHEILPTDGLSLCRSTARSNSAPARTLSGPIR